MMLAHEGTGIDRSLSDGPNCRHNLTSLSVIRSALLATPRSRSYSALRPEGDPTASRRETRPPTGRGWDSATSTRRTAKRHEMQATVVLPVTRFARMGCYGVNWLWLLWGAALTAAGNGVLDAAECRARTRDLLLAARRWRGRTMNSPGECQVSLAMTCALCSKGGHDRFAGDTTRSEAPREADRRIRADRRPDAGFCSERSPRRGRHG
eukprot:ctg_1427.g460